MIVCPEGTLETWTPDFSSSEQRNPSWTRLSFSDVELCNSLEFAVWSDNPVQVQLCEACGQDGCAVGGYVHVSRFGELVLWTSPHTDHHEESAALPLIRLGAIAFPTKTWDGLKEAVPSIPSASALEGAVGRDIADAWFLGPGRPGSIDALLRFLQARLNTGDTLDKESAIRLVDDWLTWFRERADVSHQTFLKTPNDLQVELERLYFDGVDTDWLAFARCGDKYFPALDSRHILVPARYAPGS